MTRSPRSTRTTLAVSATFLLSCAAQTAPGSRPAPAGDRTPSGFPTPSALERLPAAQLEGKFKAMPYLAVDAWTLEGPFPALGALEAHPSETAFARMLADKVEAAGGRIIANAQMYCTAREVGRFYLQNANYPSPSLETFITGRCGAPLVSLRTLSLSAGFTKEVPENKIFESWKKPLSDLMSQVGEGTQAAGVWFGRDDKHAVVVFVSGPQLSHLKGAKAEGDAVTLSGHLLVPASALRAVANRGKSGFVTCEDNKVALPAFELRCPVEASDPSTRIELGAVLPGRGIAETVGAVLWARDAAPSREYSREHYREGGTPASAATLSAALLATVNRMRGEAGVPPLELVAAESERATKLAPTYFASVSGVLSATTADAIALGLRAGWDVDGMVRGASFTSASTSNLANIDQLVETLLMKPSGRQVLLDKAATKAAIGAVWLPEQRFAGALLVTYQLVQGGAEGALAAQALESLNRARAAAGTKPVKAVRKLAEVADRLAGSSSEEIEDGTALRRMLSEGRQATGNDAVTGFMAPVLDIDATPWPAALVQEASPELGIGVGTVRPAGEPWARHAVFVLNIGAAE